MLRSALTPLLFGLVLASAAACSGARPAATVTVAPAAQAKTASSPPTPRAEPSGCPEARSVLPAIPVRVEDGDSWAWSVPVAQVPEPLERVVSASSAAKRNSFDLQPMTREAAARHGLSPFGDPVWILPEDGAPPCGMEAVELLATDIFHAPAIGAGLTTPGTMIVARLRGDCALPQKASWLPAIRAAAAPVECRFHYAEKEIYASEGKPPPAEVASAALARRCPKGTCEMTWRARSLELDGGAAAYEIAASWWKKGEDECSSSAEHLDDVFVRPARGAAWTRWRGISDLYGVLHDRRGLRGVLTSSDRASEVSVYAPSTSTPTAPAHVAHRYGSSVVPSAHFSLAPECGGCGQ